MNSEKIIRRTRKQKKRRAFHQYVEMMPGVKAASALMEDYFNPQRVAKGQLLGKLLVEEGGIQNLQAGEYDVFVYQDASSQWKSALVRGNNIARNIPKADYTFELKQGNMEALRKRMDLVDPELVETGTTQQGVEETVLSYSFTNDPDETPDDALRANVAANSPAESLSSSASTSTSSLLKFVIHVDSASSDGVITSRYSCIFLFNLNFLFG